MSCLLLPPSAGPGLVLLAVVFVLLPGTSGPARLLLRPGLASHPRCPALCVCTTIANLSAIATTFLIDPDPRCGGVRPGGTHGIRSAHARAGTAPPWPVPLERREPLHRLVRRGPHREGRGGGPGRRSPAGRRPRARPADRPYIAADPGHPDRRPGPRHSRAAWLPMQAALAAQRAPLRRTPGARQEGDDRPPRRGAGKGVAPQLRHPAARRSSGATPTTRPATPATATCRPTPCPSPSAWPTWWPGPSPTGPTPSSPTCWPRGRRGGSRPGGRPRQQPAGPAQAHRGHRRRRHRRPRDPDRHPLPLPARRRARGRVPRIPR